MINPTSTVLTPPQSPTFHHKSFGTSPTSPLNVNSNLNGISTVISLGSQSVNPPILPDHPSHTTPTFGSLLSQPVTRTVIVLTVIQSLVALGGKFPDHCTAPSHVYYAGQYSAMLASPFIVPLTPTLLTSAQQTLGTALLLAISNIASLALFEERLTAIFSGNGSCIFRNLFIAIIALVLMMRQVLGFVFSRALGWQFPQLFFSDSMHECNLGLAPFLFALLVIQALFPESSSNDSKSSSPFWTIRRIYIQVILCLLNVVPKTIVWWAASGLIVGFIVALIVSYQRRMGRWGGKVKTSAFEKQQWEDANPILCVEDEEQSMALIKEIDGEFLESTSTTPSASHYHDVSSTGPAAVRERKLSFTIYKAVTYILPMIFLLLALLTGCNQLHTFRPDVSSELINGAIEPNTPFLFTFVLMTAPRKNGVTYIKETLTSYLDNFPDEAVDPLYSRIQIIVYTHFTDFEGYDEAKAYFDTIPKARKHVKWVREEGSEKNQRKHLVSAIRKIGTSEDSVYLGIMEDDFPFCADGWQKMLNTIYDANQKVPNHCGAFIATGGSGLIFKRSVALTASFILENDVLAHERGEVVSPPDISLQNCMLGKHDYCSSCAGTMVTSRTLLQGHLGYNSSTSGEGYHRSQFQCGWRHPFNGSPAVFTV
ncbi:hypothetical protein BGZ79_004491 [Entomortierella chlamydospora]|nr:hypothetical protein BGZ79_004491 [Entomortierella chlamydospora]